MGKFNSTDGVNFVRNLNEIRSDYASYLMDKGVITDVEFDYFINDEQGQLELIDALMTKVYETKNHRGVEVSTVNAFFHYCKFVIGNYKGKDVWNSFVKDMFQSIEYNKNICIMASRSLGKSFFTYALYSSFKMFLHRNTKILAVSNIPIQCIENLRILKELIDTNEALFSKKEVHLGKELKWTERQIQYNGGMFYTLSAGTSPRGLHVHYTIVDDMITEGCQLNDEEAVNYVFGQLYPTVQRMKGRMVVSGTPQHYKDLYHFLMGEKPDFEGDIITDGRLSWKGYFSKTFPISDGEVSLYPDIYSTDEIFGPDGIKQVVGENRFLREYMLICVDATMTIFTEHLIGSCSDGSLDYWYSPPKSFGSNRFVIGADVATSGHASADYSAFIVLELIPTEKGIRKALRHIVHVKGMEISEQIKTLSYLSKTFNNALVIVEKNNVGVALIQELQKMNVNVEPFVTSKHSKESMIRYLVNEMKNGNVWFCYDTEPVSRLKRELINFGVKKNRAGVERMEALSGHDDLVMAFAMANQGAQNSGGIGAAITIQRKR